MAEPERVRIEVAFDGGQIMGALVAIEAADALEQAIASGSDSSLALAAHDGTYHVVVPRIVYVKRFAATGRVGFGAA
jgi:hypothetical protein